MSLAREDKGSGFPRGCPRSVAALAVVWLAALLLGGGGAAVDRQILSALHLQPQSFLVHPAIAVTQLGGWIILTLLGLSGAAFLAARKRMHDALVLIAAIVTARALVELQKPIFARARPDVQHLVDVSSLSFPSGHAANATVTYMMLAALLFGTRPALLGAMLLAVLVGFSRVMLGVHWPSDVIGGWAFGLLWTLAFVRLSRPRRPSLWPDGP